MDYKVVLIEDTEADLDQFVRYLLFVKESERAVDNLLDDSEAAKRNLAQVAGSLCDCESPRSKEHGCKRINLMSHRHFMLHRTEGDKVIVDNIFHKLQDYKNQASQS